MEFYQTLGRSKMRAIPHWWDITIRDRYLVYLRTYITLYHPHRYTRYRSYKPRISTTETQNVGHETGSGNHVWTETDGEATQWLPPYFLPCPNRNMTLPTRPDVGGHRKRKCRHEPKVETGSGNNFWTVTDGEAIPLTTPIFSTMPDPSMTLPAWPDDGRHRKLKCRPRNRKWKPEVKITFERKQMAKRFQRLPHIFDHARLRYWTTDTARHRPTSATSVDIGNSSGGHETGSGNNFWTETD